MSEWDFLIKITRNVLILSGLYFFSVWATTQKLDFLIHIKPIVVFLGTYILTECVKRYKLDSDPFKEINKPQTLIL